MTEKQTSDALALGRIRAVIDILQTINNIQTTESIVVRIHDILAPLIPFDRFTFGLQAWGHLYCIEGTRVEKAPGIHIIKGQYPEPTVDRDEVIGESASHWTVANCRPLIRSDISKEMCFEHDERRVAEGMLSDLIVPIVVDDQIVGTFNFTSRAPGVYTKEHLETAESVADGIATVARAFGTHLSRVSSRSRSPSGRKNSGRPTGNSRRRSPSVLALSKNSGRTSGF